MVLLTVIVVWILIIAHPHFQESVGTGCSKTVVHYLGNTTVQEINELYYVLPRWWGILTLLIMVLFC